MATTTHPPPRGRRQTMPLYVVLISLLRLTASGAETPRPNHRMTTGQVNSTHSQTTQEMRTLGNVPGQTFTLSMKIPTSPTPQTPTVNPSTAQTVAYRSKSLPPPMTNTIKGTHFTTRSTAGFVVSEATTTTVPTPTSTRTSQSHHTNLPATPPGTVPSTNVPLMTSTFREPAQNHSTTPVHVTSSAAKPSTSSYKTSTPTTKTPSIRTTKPNKNTGRKQETKNGQTVAGVIGGALVLMMIGFMVIYVKKHKLQKQQISTANWAGPTPFLESGADNSQVTLRSSNRISISSFLPQRLSKRLSLLPEVGEEMEDIPAASTFGEKSTNPTKSSKDSPKTAETSVPSSQGDKDHQDQDESPQTPSGHLDHPPGEQTDEP